MYDDGDVLYRVRVQSRSSTLPFCVRVQCITVMIFNSFGTAGEWVCSQALSMPWPTRHSSVHVHVRYK